MQDAQPLKEFLAPQLRDASSTNLHTEFELTFPAAWTRAPRAKKLAERLAPLRRRAAHVAAEREGRELMARLGIIAQSAAPDSAPRYELWVHRRGPADAEYEIWRMPAPWRRRCAWPGCAGRNLELVEHRVLQRLARAGVKPGRGANASKRGYALDEDLALRLGLLFRALAPIAQPRKHARRGRRHRDHGARGGGLLAGHGHATASARAAC